MIGFQSRFVEAICDQDGRDWKLTKPIVYSARNGQTYVVPRGASTDGASTPAIIASILPPTGDYWLAAVLHDAAYRNDLRLVDGITRADLSKDDCDDLLLEAMELTGVDPIVAETIFQGVQLGGSSAYRADRT